MNKKVKKDFYLAMSAIAVIIVCIRYLFVGNVDHMIQQSDIGHSIMTIEKVENLVRHNKANSFNWRPAQEGKNIFNGDSIFTGNNSRATLVTKNGDIFNLPSSSRLKFNAQGKTQFILDRGNLAVRLNPSSDDSLKFLIKGRNIVLSSGAFNVEDFKGKKSLISLSKGKKEVLFDNKKIYLQPRQRVVFETSGEYQIYDEDFQLIKPLPLEKFFSNGEREIVFVWDYIKKVKNTTLILSKNPDFRDAKKINGSGNILRQKLEVGLWYWKILFDRRESRVQSFEIINTAPPRMLQQSFSFTTGEKIILEWESSYNANSYELQLDGFETIRTDKGRVVLPKFSMAQELKFRIRKKFKQFSVNGDWSDWKKISIFENSKKKLSIKNNETVTKDISFVVKGVYRGNTSIFKLPVELLDQSAMKINFNELRDDRISFKCRLYNSSKLLINSMECSSKKHHLELKKDLLTESFVFFEITASDSDEDLSGVKLHFYDNGKNDSKGKWIFVPYTLEDKIDDLDSMAAKVYWEFENEKNNTRKPSSSSPEEFFDIISWKNYYHQMNSEYIINGELEPRGFWVNANKAKIEEILKFVN